jgi:hypothetical protein
MDTPYIGTWVWVVATRWMASINLKLTHEPVFQLLGKLYYTGFQILGTIKIGSRIGSGLSISGAVMLRPEAEASSGG